MRPYTTFTLIILGIAVGLLLTAQWKTAPQRTVNPIAPYLALKKTNQDLIKEQTDLKNEIANIQKAIDSTTTLSRQDTASKNLVEKGKVLKEQVGLTQRQGGGVVITLDDAPSGQGSSDNITHAADLRDIVNLLWKNGASAISINGERVVANTSIDCIVNTILINNTKTTAPFVITAIGDMHKLEKEVNDTNNLSDLWKRVKSDGVVFKVKTNWRVTVPAYNGSFILRFAKQGVE